VPRAELLVVAGEASGDEMAASVVERLRVPAFGLGGDRLAAAGVELVAHVRNVSSMGAFPVLRRSLCIAGALGGLIQRLRRHRPSAALLVGFSELNARLGPMLRRRSVPVLWYCPPQVWAWRAARVRTLARACDRMAVVLPFEEPLWRDAGARATYVGHPAFDPVAARTDRAQASMRRVALLPGSRDAEVRRHLPMMLEAVAQRAVHAELVLAESLSAQAARWAREEAATLGVPVSAGLARAALAGCDAALATSGTATLECVAAACRQSSSTGRTR
jgi:lipid-A-disaccharide synthase